MPADAPLTNDPHDNLAPRVGQRLSDKGWMLAAAESCTGGMVAAALTDIAGSSAWFERGFVTYSNEAKTELLGVPAGVIAAHGAVSEPVARAMAEGALRASRAQIAVSITGVAGPGGGSKDKPVGTVVFAWAASGLETRCETRHFSGDRRSIRQQSTAHALSGVLRLLDA
jgi:nicotinamide-nucleotide amidase